MTMKEYDLTADEQLRVKAVELALHVETATQEVLQAAEQIYAFFTDGVPVGHQEAPKTSRAQNPEELVDMLDGIVEEITEASKRAGLWLDKWLNQTKMSNGAPKTKQPT
jgi:hypothetical protein